MQRINYQSESVLISAQNDVEKQKFQHQVTSRSVEITSRGKHKIASANFDESGEYDDAMREWTVHFLRANNASYCPLELLPILEIKIGGSTGYNCSFATDREEIAVRVYSVRSQDEKSFSLTIRNDLVLLGRVTGWPEGRSPDSADDEEFNGTLESLLPVLQSGSLGGVKILIGCAVFKNSLLRSQNKPKIAEEMGIEWETFE